MALNEWNILKQPLLTERSSHLKEQNNQYVFKVDPLANKWQIKDAVQKIFKVNVRKVRTMNFDGKLRRLSQGRPQGRRIAWKKAIITLQEGQKINIEAES
ncbi:MAG: 50S ribosomal protein L23 [Elusimicrobia bacterium RIFCSPLOWO2_02_FULL_39_32]|nr:MAG: 50S ribosomal protein L23 [Elusimicrobia bacterium GWA2_38_7]OGR80886.1 MAG: 50S ribosomal protein L23 [Elusimicrobia bacterium RIFCSPHIGHO2_02_FULL_39_36]OGR93765.1 MAG: 50S ribosomal protein L23 [Elusimicrobia bacterium RIFCSPLOWO2_02_FULL_39_32]OGS00981.1 MAG: 50S ribosomal protein L23 [Elusimicrobia bacterium RIFCSPLOWO2_12_FULL_39_28]